MKKKITVLVLIGVMAFSFAACRDSNDGYKKSSSTANEGDSSKISGETYDTGKFKVFIPDGWMALKMNDTSGETDEDGNYPVDKFSVGIIKGGSSEWDAFSKPTIYIWVQDDNEMASYAESVVKWYNESKKIDVAVEGKETVAYETKMSYGSSEDDEVYIYNQVFIQLDNDHIAQVSVPADMGDDIGGVSVTDADVKAIIESVEMD